jgi:hypothetical protein
MFIARKKIWRASKEYAMTTPLPSSTSSPQTSSLQTSSPLTSSLHLTTRSTPDSTRSKSRRSMTSLFGAIALFAIAGFLFAAPIASAQTWTRLATDPQGDELDNTLADGTGFYYYYDKANDSLWFRVDVSAASYSPSKFGVNIVYNVPTTEMATTWYGNQNTDFSYNRVLTAWVQLSIKNTYYGVVGCGDAAGVQNNDINNLDTDNIKVKVNDKTSSYILGLKKTDFYAGSLDGITLIAAVGSNTIWNDDIPNTGHGTLTSAGVLSPNAITGSNSVLSLGLTVSGGFNKGIAYTLRTPDAQHLKLRAYNLLGSVVREIDLGNQAPGRHVVSAEMLGLHSGSYLFELRGDQNTRATALLPL